MVLFTPVWIGRRTSTGTNIQHYTLLEYKRTDKDKESIVGKSTVTRQTIGQKTWSERTWQSRTSLCDKQYVLQASTCHARAVFLCHPLNTELIDVRVKEAHRPYWYLKEEWPEGFGCGKKRMLDVLRQGHLVCCFYFVEGLN